MNDKLKYYLNDFERKNEGVLKEVVKTVQKQLDFNLPEVYLDFMKEYNICEGKVGKK
jgi:hypothetical protein